MLNCFQICLNFAFNFNLRRYTPDLASLQESCDAFRSQVYTAGTPASFTISVKDIYGRAFQLVHFSAQPEPF